MQGARRQTKNHSAPSAASAWGFGSALSAVSACFSSAGLGVAGSVFIEFLFFFVILFVLVLVAVLAVVAVDNAVIIVIGRQLCGSAADFEDRRRMSNPFLVSPVEGVCPNDDVRGRDADGREPRAVRKGFVADTGNACADDDGFKVWTMVERIAVNAPDRIGKNDLPEILASHEIVGPDPFDAGGNHKAPVRG